jgi:hypothetical protein
MMGERMIRKARVVIFDGSAEIRSEEHSSTSIKLHLYAFSFRKCVC